MASGDYVSENCTLYMGILSVIFPVYFIFDANDLAKTPAGCLQWKCHPVVSNKESMLLTNCTSVKPVAVSHRVQRSQICPQFPISTVKNDLVGAKF